MSAHTNGKIPRYNEHSHQLFVQKLVAEKEFFEKLAESYASELRNIPEAIEQYGHWDYDDAKGNTISLVKKES